MQIISKLTDLEKYGIYPLTGEACGLMMRILCDYDEKGKNALSQRFGMYAFQGSEPWNSSTRGNKHVGSIMLAPEDYISLGVFCLMFAGCTHVFELKYKEHPQTSVNKLRRSVQAFVGKVTQHDFSVGKVVDFDAELDIARHALAGCADDTLFSPGVLFGWESGEHAEMDEWLKCVKRDNFTYRYYRVRGDNQDRTRFTHQMSGRSV